MSDELLVALLLNFGAVVGVLTFNAPIYSRSIATIYLAPFLVPMGTFASFGAIALFLWDRGFGSGLLWWLVSALIFATPARYLGRLDGLRSIIGLLAIVAGAVWGILVFMAA